MKILFLLITFFCAVKIYTSRDVQRMLWLFGSIVYLHDQQVAGPFSIHAILLISFIISALNDYGLMRRIRAYPLKYSTLLLLIVFFLVGLMDSRISFISRFSRPITFFMKSYLCFLLGFISLKRSSDFKRLVNGIVIIVIPVAIWGIITFILQNNPYYDQITIAFNDKIGIWGNVQTRGYRVCSFLSNPIVYGAVIGMLSFFLYLFWEEKSLSKKSLLCGFLLINVLLSNSRTGIVSVVLFVFLYTFLYHNDNFIRIIRNVICGAIILLILYEIPYFHQIIDSVYDLYITGGEGVQGSNLQLRELQMAESLRLFYKKPLFGHGFGAFHEELGAVNENIAGMESYIFSMLIENGIIMIIAVTIFTLHMMKVCFTFSNKKYKYFCLSAYVTLLFFICATGTYGNVFEYFALIIGCTMRQIQLLNRRKKFVTEYLK